MAFRRRPDNIEGLLEILRNSGTPTILLADPTARTLATGAAVWLQCPLATDLAFDSYAVAMSVVALLADRVVDLTGRPGQLRATGIDASYRSLGEIENR